MLSWALAGKEVMATNVRTKRVLRSSRGLIIIPFLSSRISGPWPWALGLGPLVLRLRSWVLVFHFGEQRPKSEGQRPTLLIIPSFSVPLTRRYPAPCQPDLYLRGPCSLPRPVAQAVFAAHELTWLGL